MFIILEDFLSDRKQRVVLNGQCFSWFGIRASAPQGSILGALLFLIYINDLSNDIKTKFKLFTDDTSLFSAVHDIDTSANDPNHDLEKISEWAFQCKIKFNLDPIKQTQEIIFSKKKLFLSTPVVCFSKTPINSTATHLGMIFDSKLSYENHFQTVLTICLLRKLQSTLPRKSLVAINKSFNGASN